MKHTLIFSLLLASAPLHAAEPATPATPAKDPVTIPVPAPKPFPESIKTCLVSGEKLGEMGKPHTFVHEGQEVKLCCKSCEKKFKKNAEKYMAIIKEAAEKH